MQILDKLGELCSLKNTIFYIITFWISKIFYLYFLKLLSRDKKAQIK